MKKLIKKIFRLFPFSRPFVETIGSQTPVTPRMWFTQKVLGINRGPYWPVSFKSLVYNWENIYAGVSTSPGIMPGCYIQGSGGIYIGDYTQIAPNVGIISGNHDIYDTRLTIKKSVKIGKYCWIGMGAIILPGVELGDHTIVGAGSVVTKSFPEGYCLIAGNPAKLIKNLEQDKFTEYTDPYEYHGYIPKAKFEKFRKKRLKI